MRAVHKVMHRVVGTLGQALALMLLSALPARVKLLSYIALVNAPF
jgi:hypothetical protein